MRIALLLLACEGALGAFDTLYYHEWKLRLPERLHARRELRLHAARDFTYAVLFLTIGWLTWNGVLAWVFAASLALEIGITLCDFIEEDRTRTLPAGERCMHAIMGIVYGLFLAHLVPEVWNWAHRSTGCSSVSYGGLSWLLTVMGIGVLLSGLRDLRGAGRLARIRSIAP